MGATGEAGVVVNAPLHPPLAVVVSSHAAKELLMAACDWQAASVLSDAQFKLIAGGGDTVNLLVQEVVSGVHVLVQVQVTSVNPPREDGATGTAGFVVITPLHPPLAVVVRSHALNEASIAACVWQELSVLSFAQVRVTAGAVVTVNVLVHVFVASHGLVSVQVTSFDSPQADGLPVLLLDSVAPQSAS